MTPLPTALDPEQAPRWLEQLVQEAERLRASDIHLQRRGVRAEIMLRLDGVLTPAATLPEAVAERVFGRIKFLARLKTYEDQLPQDGRIPRDDLGAQHDLRVASYPTVTGEKIVLRLFHRSGNQSLRDLGLSGPVVLALERFLRQTSGLLLLTGSAGSGKTTTIYACVRALAAEGGRHIITVEDPVEQVLEGVMQTEINEARGLTFPEAARHLLRQDPQVLVIGEIRDEETAHLVVRASLTGHLVISTLHAGACQRVFERLLMMCPDRFAVVSALQLILNQRLMRRLCPACHGAKCPACAETGYHGRVPIAEFLLLDEAARRQLRHSTEEIPAPNGSLREAAQDLLDRGETDAAEVARVLGAEA